jgi:hypothetical protein
MAHSPTAIAARAAEATRAAAAMAATHAADVTTSNEVRSAAGKAAIEAAYVAGRLIRGRPLRYIDLARAGLGPDGQAASR